MRLRKFYQKHFNQWPGLVFTNHVHSSCHDHRSAWETTKSSVQFVQVSLCYYCCTQVICPRRPEVSWSTYWWPWFTSTWHPHVGTLWWMKTLRGTILWWDTYYHKTSNISRTLVCNKIVDHSDVVGASPVSADPTTSSYLTQHLASMDWVKTTARRHETQLSFEIWCDLY